jgi:hypothetical protein
MSNKTAVIGFSGICTHVTKPDDPCYHQVVLVDVSDPAIYAGFPMLKDLPAHSARLLVNQKNVQNREEVLQAGSQMPFMAIGDSWSWLLNGVQISIQSGSEVSGARPSCTRSSTWLKDIPSLQHYAPLATSQPRPLAPGIDDRAAACIDIMVGEIVPVDFDPRTGGAGSMWKLPVGPDGEVKVSFTSLTDQSPDPLTLVLKMPESSTIGPVEPLIQIENVGTVDDDENDFLFHYYALFNFVPENARPPRSFGVVESGVGSGCSNSTYP